MGDRRPETMRGLLPGLALLLMVGSACEDEAPAELPEGWAEAARLPLTQNGCPQGFAPLRGNPRLEVTKDDLGLKGVYKDATFRCNDQKVCGFITESDTTTRVLVQPCQMRPSAVVRCTCQYEVTFTLPSKAGRMTLELYRRADLYGAQGPVAAALIDTERVP
jgi:hypothetical protein